MAPSLSVCELYIQYAHTVYFRLLSPHFCFIERAKRVLSSGKSTTLMETHNHMSVLRRTERTEEAIQARKQKEGEIHAGVKLPHKNTLRPKWLSALLKMCKSFVAATVDNAA